MTVTSFRDVLPPPSAVEAVAEHPYRPWDAPMDTAEPIAVVGMAGRFPACPDLETFRENVFSGRDCLTELTPEDLRRRHVDAARLANPSYVRRRPVLDRPEWFDAAAFGMTPREAQLRDPQYRLMLEISHDALTHAGYDPTTYPGRIGLYAGTNVNRYRQDHIQQRPDIAKSVGYIAVDVSNAPDYMSTFVSYKLDLRGPSMTVLTACSTSLVALHLACVALRAGDCAMALAGGVDLEFPLDVGYVPTPGGILATDGIPRPFDREATGTNFGNGVGAVLLKPLSSALADGDTVHALVLSSSVNNDGRRKVGYTAPSVAGQSECIQHALRAGGIDPRTISYVEAHGTATPVGDPIELTALADAYRAVAGAELPTGYCAIGSVKSNIGHIGQAAGIAGLIKTVLALQHRYIPPSIHVHDLNPAVDWEKFPFRVATQGQEWPSDAGPRRAAVSSFGIGGTNAHVVLEEHTGDAADTRPGTSRDGAGRPRLEPILWSGVTSSAADTYRQILAEHFADLPAHRFGDTAHTLRVGRISRAVRGAVLARTGTDAAAALRRPERALTPDGVRRPIAFAFPGQGAQRAGMLRELAEDSALFRRGCDAAFEVLDELLDADLRSLADRGTPEELAETVVAQPLLYVAEYTLAHCLIRWGVTPATVFGHSLGELVAGSVAGVFGFEEGLRAVAARARLMQEMPRGRMLAIHAPADDLRDRLPASVAVAAVNGPRQIVVGGEDNVIDEVAGICAEAGWRCRALATSHAFHSPAMNEAAKRFEAELSTLDLHEPAIELISSATGRVVSEPEATSPRFWAEQLVQPVLFDQAAATLFASGSRSVIEVGPGATLSALLESRDDARASASRVLQTLGDGGEPDADVLGATLARLWVDGEAVTYWHDSRGYRRVPAPGYPYERRRHWIDPLYGASPETATGPRLDDPAPAGPATADVASVPANRPSAGPGPAQTWALRQLTWRRDRGGRRPDDVVHPPGRTAVVLPGGGTGQAMSRTGALARLALQRAGYRVITLPSDVDCASPDPLGTALARLRDQKIAVDAVVHTGLLDLPATLTADTLDEQLATGLYPLLSACRAVAVHRRRQSAPLHLVVLARHVADVSGGEYVHPVAAMAPPLLATFAQEAAGVRTACIDVGAAPAHETLVEEFADLSAPLVALRGDQRWLPGLRLLGDRSARFGSRLRPRGTYLITGGLGGLGLRIAQALASTGLRPRLGLLGRREVVTDGGAKAGQIAPQLARLENDGAELEILTADVTDLAALTAAVERLERRFGPIDGVIHAAGLAGGGLLERRTSAEMSPVLGPKTRGLLHLDALLAGRRLDFLVLFSSQAALGGFYGSADYAAANAFMDAYARSKVADETWTVSLQWAPWSEIGMAAESKTIDLVLPSAAGGAREPSPGKAALARSYRPGDSWELDEHVFAGVTVLPGAAVMELVVLAARQAGVTQGAPVEVRDAVLLAPVVGTAPVQVRVIVEPLGDAHQFRVQARATDDQGWSEHASGTLTVAPDPREPEPLAQIQALEEDDEGPEFAGWMTFGPRWRLIRGTRSGPGQRTARLVLADQFAHDLVEHPLHPAILDVATTVLTDHEPGKQYAPFLYRRMAVYGPLPADVTVHARFSPGTTRQPRPVDVDLRDSATGALLVEVEGFTMHEVTTSLATEPGTQTAEADGPPAGVGPPAGRDPSWLAPDDGAAAFLEVLSGRYPSVVHVGPAGAAQSIPGIPLLGAEADDVPRGTEDRGASAGSTVATPLRATLDGAVRTDQPPGVLPPTGASEPADPSGPPTEAAIVDAVRSMWLEVLGSIDIGLDEDFFELGGSSLSAVQVTRRIQDVFGVRLGAGALFELNTLRLIAQEIRRSHSAT